MKLILTAAIILAASTASAQDIQTFNFDTYQRQNPIKRTYTVIERYPNKNEAYLRQLEKIKLKALDDDGTYNSPLDIDGAWNNYGRDTVIVREVEPYYDVPDYYDANGLIDSSRQW